MRPGLRSHRRVAVPAHNDKNSRRDPFGHGTGGVSDCRNWRGAAHLHRDRVAKIDDAERRGQLFGGRVDGRWDDAVEIASTKSGIGERGVGRLDHHLDRRRPGAADVFRFADADNRGADTHNSPFSSARTRCATSAVTAPSSRPSQSRSTRPLCCPSLGAGPIHARVSAGETVGGLRDQPHVALVVLHDGDHAARGDRGRPEHRRRRPDVPPREVGVLQRTLQGVPVGERSHPAEDGLAAVALLRRHVSVLRLLGDRDRQRSSEASTRAAGFG